MFLNNCLILPTFNKIVMTIHNDKISAKSAYWRVIISVFVLFATPFQQGFAQQGFTITALSGYRLPLSQAGLNPLTQSGFFQSDLAGKSPNLLGSYGQGYFAGLGGSYITRRNIEYGAQLTFSSSPEVSVRIGDEYFDKTVYSANTIGLSPFVRLNKKLKNATPYIQFGIPIYAAEVLIENSGNDAGRENYYARQYYPRQLAIGLMLGAGVKKTVSRHLQLYVDAQLTSINLKPGTGYFTEGDDSSPARSEKRSLNTKESIEKYGQSIILPFSTFSVGVGLIYTLSTIN